MIEPLQELVNTNPALVRRGRWTDVDMLLGIGDAHWMVTVRAGRIERIEPEAWAVSGWDFAIKGTKDAWEAFWQPVPPPRHHDLSALIREGKMRFEGNTDLLLANFLYLKLILETLRGRV
ncbi:MAG: hypothetical protein AAFV19_22430 [Pseudomonadota bacterium]